MNHETYMALAIKEAEKALRIDEVPIGAVIVRNGEVIAKAHNLRETKQQASAHAELLAIEKACRKLKSWRLDGCVLYVTLEPCTMCAGASILSRVDGIVYGASDPKGGSLGSLYDLTLVKGFNHYPWVISGISSERCSGLLKDFFNAKREQKRDSKSTESLL
jgi:tRNA(adenine34) deaminase